MRSGSLEIAQRELRPGAGACVRPAALRAGNAGKNENVARLNEIYTAESSPSAGRVRDPLHSAVTPL